MAEPEQSTGLINAVKKGDFYNAVNRDVRSRPLFTTADTTLSMCTKLNEIQNLSSYNVVRALVVDIEEQTSGGILAALFDLFGSDDAKNTVSKIAYVYIDTIHGSLKSLINPLTMRAILTEVPVYGGDVVTIGMMIEVSLDAVDHGVGKYIKKVADPVSRGSLTSAEARQLICASPSVTPEVPSPSSTPANFNMDNVGYLQALYVLAKWQADNPTTIISEIHFPFIGAGTVGSAIKVMLDKAKKTNDKVLENKSQDANPAKQWIKYMTKLLDSAVRYKDNPTDGRILVRLATTAIDVRPIVSKIDSFTAYYTVPYGNGSQGAGVFYMSFPKSNKKIPLTNELLAMTEKNLEMFLENFENTYAGTPSTGTPTSPPPPSALTQVCSELYSFEGEWSKDAQLSPHFKVRELDKDGVAHLGTTVVTKKKETIHITGEELTTNLKTLASNLEVIRAALIQNFGSTAEKMYITLRGGYQPSWDKAGTHWRKKPSFYGESPAGKVIGKDGNPKGRSTDGQHRRGKAADIQVPGVNSSDVWNVVKDLMVSGKIVNGGLGYYPSFIHYDIRSHRSRWYEHNKYGQHYPWKGLKTTKGFKNYAQAKKWGVKLGLPPAAKTG